MSNENYSISYAELEKAGWPANVIEDYQSFKRAISPQFGTTADPNDVFESNMSQLYFDKTTQTLWINPSVGVKTGWLQVTL